VIRPAKLALWGLALVVLVLGVLRLEVERASVLERPFETAEGPVRLYTALKPATGPLVVVTHGFAGSTQMMQYISRDLARAGFTVAAFDFYGHGRSEQRLSPDVTRIEGTTRQLVQQTHAVVDALQAETGLVGTKGLVGHSMATDIIIRAARARSDISGIVAISMYSDAITQEFPKRLLILSGSWEGRLRNVGRAAVAQVGGAELEGITVTDGEILRRAVSVPHTEHVAVLFASQTLEETRLWLAAALGIAPGNPTVPQGPALLAVLLAICVLSWPLARLLPLRRAEPQPPNFHSFWIALLLPVIPAICAAMVVPGALLGLAGFGNLLAFLVVWGGLALAMLIHRGHRVGQLKLTGLALLLFWGLGVFGLALDRYAAAFLPTGPRLPLLVLLLPGTLLFMLADRFLVDGAGIARRIAARVVPVAALSGAMVLGPGDLGLLFTVLPVLVLFYLVYGTMGRAIALRCGPDTAAVGLAVILAWAIAASTPLFAT
jgi:pimeloyl-ACP methyl ester carboxylesterase